MAATINRAPMTNFARPAEVDSALSSVLSAIYVPPGPRREPPLDLVNCTDSIIIRRAPLSDESHLLTRQLTGRRGVDYLIREPPCTARNWSNPARTTTFNPIVVNDRLA